MENENQARRAGDSNEITRQYFDSLLIEMRHIDAVLPSTKLELYGETFDTPVMTAAGHPPFPAAVHVQPHTGGALGPCWKVARRSPAVRTAQATPTTG